MANAKDGAQRGQVDTLGYGTIRSSLRVQADIGTRLIGVTVIRQRRGDWCGKCAFDVGRVSESS